MTSSTRETNGMGNLECIPEVAEAFIYVALNPYNHLDLESHFQLLERVTVVLYDKGSNLDYILPKD